MCVYLFIFVTYFCKCITLQNNDYLHINSKQGNQKSNPDKFTKDYNIQPVVLNSDKILTLLKEKKRKD